jgi:hypothetical protein
MTVCYLERGRARMEHLLIENLQLPPYQHNEVRLIIPCKMLNFDVFLILGNRAG